jgi:hypothetical protein
MTREAKDPDALSRIDCFSLAQGVLNGLPVFQLVQELWKVREKL